MDNNEFSTSELKHLEFIQNVITRMNSNSFQLKNISITIASLILGINFQLKDYLFIYLAISSTLVFWTLDSYYLQQERKFRGVYNDAIKGKINLFEMNPTKYKGSKYSFIKVFLSKTLIIFYSSIIICLIVVVLYFNYKGYGK